MESGLININEIALAIITGVTMGLTQLVKCILPDAIAKKFAPLFALFIGLGASIFWYGYTKDNILLGVIAGLSAGGLWSVVKDPIFKKVN